MKFIDTPIGAAVLGWLVLGVCTLIFKPRSPESYAALALRNPVWFFARFAAFWQLAGGLGIDPAKVAAAAFKVITGRVQPLETGLVPSSTATKPDDGPPSSDPPSSGGATPLIVGACLMLVACSSTPAPPAQSESTKQNTADTTYFLDMMACRDTVKYPTLAQSDACLSATRLRWHRLPDGGADGSFDDGGASHDGGITDGGAK